MPQVHRVEVRSLQPDQDPRSRHVRSEAEALVLVKPQFEVGRDRVGRGGVVRDPAAHCDAIDTVVAAAEALDWHPQGIVASPITGPAGNHEYVLWLGANRMETGLDFQRLVDNTLS